MQTSAAYHSTISLTAENAPAPRRPSSSNALQMLARQWDLVGVAILMLSSSIYGIYALLFVAH